MARFSFTVNGTVHDIEVPESTPLLYVLRDQLELNGPRYGCGAEQCGACRVIIDGELAYACTREASSLAGSVVETVDGLGGPNRLHPLQRAFLEHNAGQCGYCASGILMTAHALLQENSDPTREQIQQALKDNLCRCGAHNRIIKAVQRAAELMKAPQ